MKVKKWLKRLGITAVVLFVAAEISVRLIFGLGGPLLFRSDDAYEYIAASDQDLMRFGNHIFTNSYGLRCPEPTEQDAVRILKIGDSVIFGGAHTDQDSLASIILEKQLSEHFGKTIRIINVSCGSWGPDNAAAFVQKHGDFDADALLMVYSSHDYTDNMLFKGIVGKHPSYPDKKPVLALWEGLSRYALPRIIPSMGRNYIAMQGMAEKENQVNVGWQWWADYAREKQWPTLAVIHPTTNEIKDKSYNDKGTALIQLLDSLNVPVLRELDAPAKRSAYLDAIHYNSEGQKFLASEVYPWLEETVEGVLNPAPPVLPDTVPMPDLGSE